MNERHKDWSAPGFTCEYPGGCDKQANVAWGCKKTCLAHASTDWWLNHTKSEEKKLEEDLDWLNRILNTDA